MNLNLQQSIPHIKAIAKSLSLWTSVLWLLIVTQQSVQAANYLSQHFSYAEIGINSQYWAITQDAKGFIYAGSTYGVLTYNGLSWKKVNGIDEHVQAMSYGYDDKVYIGISRFNAPFDFGYLQSNQHGELSYVSLAHLLAPYQEVKSIWHVNATKSGVYFSTEDALFKYADGVIKRWNIDHHFILSFVINDLVLIAKKGQGLFYLDQEQLRPFPGGDFFSGRAKDIFGITAYKNQGYLVATRNKGLFTLVDGEVQKFPTQADYLFDQHQINKIIESNDKYIVSLVGGGIVILDEQGTLVKRLIDDGELLGNTSYSLFVDEQFGLWAAMDNGLSRVQLPYSDGESWSVFDKKFGIRGHVNKVIRFNKTLFAGSSDGLYQLFNEENKSAEYFQRVENATEGVTDLVVFNQQLVALVTDGLLFYDGSQVHKHFLDFRVVSVLALPERDVIVLGLERGGVLIVSYAKQQISIKHHLMMDNQYAVTSLHSMGNNNVLVATNNGEYYDLIFNADHQPHIAAIKTPPQLKSGSVIKLTDQTFIISTNDGNIWQLDYGPTSVVTEITELYRTNKNDQIYFVAGTLNAPWLVQLNDKRIVLTQGIKENNQYLWQRFPQLEKLTQGSGNLFLEDKNEKNQLWIGSYNKIVRVELGQVYNKYENVKATIQGLKTSIDGVSFDYTTTTNIPNKSNNIRVQYALPQLNALGMNLVQQRLLGVSDNWSEPTLVDEALYLGLAPGDYQFQVKPAFSPQSSELLAEYSFTILPPWYATYWAFILYFAVFIGLFWAVLHLRSRQLQQRTLLLEREVHAKTTEIAQQNALLAQKNEDLQHLNNMKSEFFANISHELRTPLTLNLSPIEDMIKGKYGQLSNSMSHALQVMHRNSRQLLSLINELLALSRLENAQQSLNVECADLVLLIKECIAHCVPLSSSRNISISFDTEDKASNIYIDAAIISHVIDNLLTNALKYCQEHDKVVIWLNTSETMLSVHIKDNGPGIPKKDLPLVFDRFYQVNNNQSNHLSSTGIGLALVKEYMELHQGNVEVRSEYGLGSEFILTFKRGHQHFKEIEIMEPAVAGAPLKIERDVDRLASITEVTSEQHHPANSQQAHRPSRKTLLIVEDNDDLRHYLVKQFSQDFNVVQAIDGLDGLNKAEKLLPDMIISDITMPKMDGKALCQSLKAKQLTYHIPIILLTAQAQEQQVIEGLEVGANDYLTKPFSSDELLLRVKNQLSLITKLQQRHQQQIQLSPAAIDVESADDAFMKKALEIIEQRFAESIFGVDELAADIGLSRRQLLRKLKALTGNSPAEIIRDIRLERAAILLKQRAANVSQTAYAVGFDSAAHFSRAFKAKFGVTPSNMASKQ